MATPTPFPRPAGPFSSPSRATNAGGGGGGGAVSCVSPPRSPGSKSRSSFTVNGGGGGGGGLAGGAGSPPSRSSVAGSSIAGPNTARRSLEWDAEADADDLLLSDHSHLRIQNINPTGGGKMHSRNHSDAGLEAASFSSTLSAAAASASGSAVLGGGAGYDHSSSSSAPEQSSVNSSVFVLSASTLGAGILALPHAMSLLGWLFGSLLLLAVGLTSSYAIRLLLETAKAVGAVSYEELGHAIFPRFGRRLVVSCTLILIFGSLTAFFVIIADTVTPALQSITGAPHSVWTRREVLLSLVAIVVVFPLCLLRSIHALERWSYLAVGIIFAFSMLVIAESVRALKDGSAGPDSNDQNPDVASNVRLVDAQVQMFEALPIICLAFTCQTMIFPLWKSLTTAKNTTKKAVSSGAGAGAHGLSHEHQALREHEHQHQHEHEEDSVANVDTGLAPTDRMWSVVNRSMVLCSLLYLPVGVFGFFAFGQNTKGDILTNYPSSNFFDAVRLAFALAICIHYPVIHFGFRLAILLTWYGQYDEQQNRKRFLIITGLSTHAANK